MKTVKKMMALVIALTMSVGIFGVTAFAATVTMNTQAGHTYQVYQIFTGTVDGNNLTEVKYGTSSKGTPGEYVSATDLAKLKTLSDLNLTDEHVIIEKYSEFVDFSNPATTVAGGASIQDLAPGYYIIRDLNDVVPDEKPLDTTTLYMFKVLNDTITVSAKAGTVESEKHVDDQNDSDADDHSELKDSADYDIGDEIPYTLTFKLPDNYAKFEKYYVQFSDDMDEGLSLIANSVKIQYGSAAKQSITFTAASGTKYTGGQLYTYEIKDLKTTAPDLKAGDVITITYKAFLNDKAKVGSVGNPNTYSVKFSNNPNKSGEGQPTGDTPWDKNIVFTYKTVFDKVDENGAELPGADFTLQKLVGENWVDVTELGGQDGKHPSKIGSSADKSTSFEFRGLDAGDYRLIESYTPDGYNTISPILFTITADHELVSDDPKLTSLTGTDGAKFTMTKVDGAAHYTAVTTYVEGTTTYYTLENGEYTEKPNVSPSDFEGMVNNNITLYIKTTEDYLTTSIMNKSGIVLPETGGMGTTMFYIIGAVLVLGAGVILVSRRRASAQ